VANQPSSLLEEPGLALADTNHAEAFDNSGTSSTGALPAGCSSSAGAGVLRG